MTYSDTCPLPGSCHCFSLSRLFAAISQNCRRSVIAYWPSSVENLHCIHEAVAVPVSWPETLVLLQDQSRTNNIRSRSCRDVNETLRSKTETRPILLILSPRWDRNLDLRVTWVCVHDLTWHKTTWQSTNSSPHDTIWLEVFVT